METLQSIRVAINRQEWLTSLDLKEAYLHVPILPNHRKWLRFRYENLHWQYKALPFGLSTAPRTFTKILIPLIANLRKEGIKIHPYLDDILIRSPTYDQALRDTARVISYLQEHGFVINFKKSHLSPSQSLEHLGVIIDTRSYEICLNMTQRQQKIHKLEAELEQCQAKLLVVETQHNSQVEPLCKALEVSRADNKKLALSLDQALQANNTLQSKLTLVQDELDNKEVDHQQLMACREQLIEETKMEAKLYAERLESLKKQFHIEREAVRKATHRELAELKKAQEEVSSKSAEISRANRELRQKVMELEKSLASHKVKIRSQKALIRQYLDSKTNRVQNTERLKEIESELRQMELIKEQYQKKNYEQSLSIKRFMTELTSLQGEMQMLAKNQHEVTMHNRHLQTQLEMEWKLRQQLEDQCQTLEDTVRNLKKCKEETEHKLKEASIESEQITANLEEAHRWFKSKFDNLQLELVKNRQQKILGEEDYEKEDVKERPMKFPSQASLHLWETKQQLKLISRKYQSELSRK
uniref:ribonuclease H n=1 Tax=Sphenodon punctatus TaxID=8508 RepID=A0A8D0HV98_SPHPU